MEQIAPKLIPIDANTRNKPYCCFILKQQASFIFIKYLDNANNNTALTNTQIVCSNIQNKIKNKHNPSLIR